MAWTPFSHIICYYRHRSIDELKFCIILCFFDLHFPDQIFKASNLKLALQLIRMLKMLRIKRKYEFSKQDRESIPKLWKFTKITTFLFFGCFTRFWWRHQGTKIYLSKIRSQTYAQFHLGSCHNVHSYLSCTQPWVDYLSTYYGSPDLGVTVLFLKSVVGP